MPRPAAPVSGAETALDAAVAAYLSTCAIEGKTARTLQAYRETLAQFAAICTREALPAEVGAFRALHIYTFLQGVADRGSRSGPAIAASARRGPSSPGARGWASAPRIPSRASRT